MRIRRVIVCFVCDFGVDFVWRFFLVCVEFVGCGCEMCK